MRKLDKTETLVTIGDMTYVREVTKLFCMVVCVYISSLTQFAYFLKLFGLVNLLSKPSNAFKAQILLLHVFAQRVTLTPVRVTHFTQYPIYNFRIYLLFLCVNCVDLHSVVDILVDIGPIYPGYRMNFFLLLLF